VKTSQSKVSKKESRPVTIKSATDALIQHWVYDALTLLNDCAVALERITQLLIKLEERPEWLEGCEQDAMKEVSEFISFIEEWDSLARKRLTNALVCPDKVEFHLRKILKAINMPTPDKKKILRRWLRDCQMEPRIVEIARLYWDQ
jgi:hypothetical protein